MKSSYSKFRAWDVVRQEYISKTEMVLLMADGTPVWLAENTVEPFENDIIVEHLTELHDIKGREIYAGDMIDLSRDEFPDDTPNPMEVVFIDGAFRRKYSSWREGLPYPILCQREIQVMHFEVIGDIHHRDTV